MTRDEIIRMAQEAGIDETRGWFNCVVEEFTRFAELVAAAEREACAKVADDHIGDGDYMAERIAAAIRARREQ